ncbi:MAG TPA: cell envelope integrity protein TolA [Ramlibacter sp.]|nr:cell envelope integrity protein TolA [Ramlibacter sp.]
MHAAADRPEFAPPPQPGLVRGFALAVLAHLVLLFALMHGLQWQRESENAVAEAELWSAVPQQAAPREQPAPPPPPPAPPPPVVRAPPRPEPPVQRQPDIALEREKQRRAEEKERQQELADKREQEKREQAKREQEQRKAEAQKKREEELARRKEEEARKVAEARRKEEEQKKREQLEARDAKRREQLRQEQLARMQNMAGTGSPDATGNSARSAGPSASWGAKVQAKVRPNIVFTDMVSGNPRAEVEVRTSPDGTIVNKRLVRSSGSKAWDEAVLRALDRTGSLPRDVDGRVPSPVVITFRPND